MRPSHSCLSELWPQEPLGLTIFQCSLHLFLLIVFLGRDGKRYKENEGQERGGGVVILIDAFIG